MNALPCRNPVILFLTCQLRLTHCLGNKLKHFHVLAQRPVLWNQGNLLLLRAPVPCTEQPGSALAPLRPQAPVGAAWSRPHGLSRLPLPIPWPWGWRPARGPLTRRTSGSAPPCVTPALLVATCFWAAKCTAVERASVGCELSGDRYWGGFTLFDRYGMLKLHAKEGEAIRRGVRTRPSRGQSLRLP